MTERDRELAAIKMSIAWLGTMLGSFTLSEIVLLATLIYTVLNIIKLVRDLWRTRKAPAAASAVPPGDDARAG
jgi:hypothetical protein